MPVLLERGADVDARDGLGWVPLHHCAYTDLKIVQMLLAAGANPSIANNAGHTPLHQAITGNVNSRVGRGVELNRSILRALVDHGAAVADAEMQAKLKTLLEQPAGDDA